MACRKQSNSLKNWESIKFGSLNKSNSRGIETHTLKDKTTPGSKTAPDFITTPSHTIECISLQPSSILTLSHIYEPSIETFDPIVQPPPTTEFDIFVLFPILVPFPITVKEPISAERDCTMSGGKNQSFSKSHLTEKITNTYYQLH